MLPIRLVSAAALLLSISAFERLNWTVSPETPPARRQYGPMQKIGNGTVRTYVTLDEDDDRVPLEIGVAMSESALEGLPAPVPVNHADHASMMANMHMFVLALPAKNPTPYKFVQFDWNPAGHDPQGVYDQPHFDFHFWRVAESVRESIVPTDSLYGAKAAAYPANGLRPPYYVDAATAAKAPAAAASVPLMGMHWLDVRSPELQGLAGKPQDFKTFTKTYLYGTWNGEFIFDEPMITRAYLASKRTATDPAVRDEVIPIATQPRYGTAGFYPSAYRISYDPKSKEYRVALTQLVRRD